MILLLVMTVKKRKTKRTSSGENEILLTNYKPKYEEHKCSVKNTLRQQCF